MTSLSLIFMYIKAIFLFSVKFHGIEYARKIVIYLMKK